MIAFAASLRILENKQAFDTSNAFDVLPRWSLEKI
jgi:N6-L-threonylcarbamoyladenine synthase